MAWFGAVMQGKAGLVVTNQLFGVWQGVARWDKAGRGLAVQGRVNKPKEEIMTDTCVLCDEHTLLTVSECASICLVSTRSILRWSDKGLLHPIYVGHHHGDGKVGSIRYASSNVRSIFDVRYPDKDYDEQLTEVKEARNGN